MFVCEKCLNQRLKRNKNTRSSILPISYGPCEDCKVMTECYEVYIHDKKEKDRLNY